MPIENERDYVLYDPHGELERYLLGQVNSIGHLSQCDIQQGYLTAENRIRRLTYLPDGMPIYRFTYKQRVDGQVVEIETAIDRNDYETLWPESHERVLKTRFTLMPEDEAVRWDIDFLKQAGVTYFAKAEAEMPVGMAEPLYVPAFLAPFVIHKADLGDRRFKNRRLSDIQYARMIIQQVQTGTLPSSGLF